MMRCVHSRPLSRRRKVRQDKWERRLRQLAQMRAAKQRKRLANPLEREPGMTRYFPLELGVRDKRSGDTAWIDFRSVRDAARRLTVIQTFYRS